MLFLYLKHLTVRLHVHLLKSTMQHSWINWDGQMPKQRHKMWILLDSSAVFFSFFHGQIPYLIYANPGDDIHI